MTLFFFITLSIVKGYAKFWDKIGFRREKLEGYEQILTGDLAGKKLNVTEWKEELVKYVLDMLINKTFLLIRKRESRRLWSE